MSLEWSRPVVVKANERIISVAGNATVSNAVGKAGKQALLGTRAPGPSRQAAPGIPGLRQMESGSFTIVKKREFPMD
jgi:hypothetical protein